MKGFYLSAGLVEDPQHCERIGPALWEFEWLIAHETREAGRVLNGAPITAKRIAASLGRHLNTVKANLARLEREHYIERFRKPGLSYEYRIANSKKWKPDGDTENSITPNHRVTPKTVRGSHRNMCEGHTENCPAIKEVDILDSEIKSVGAKAPASRATQLPKDFQPNEQHQRLAKELGVDLQNCFASFCDHHAAKGNTFRDWNRALNTWLRNEIKFNRSRNGTGNGKLSTADIVERECAIARARTH